MKKINFNNKKNTIIDRIAILSKQKEFINSNFYKALVYDLYNRVDLITTDLEEENLVLDFHEIFYFAVEQQKKFLNIAILDDEDFKNFDIKQIEQKREILKNIEKSYLLKEIKNEKIFINN